MRRGPHRGVFRFWRLTRGGCILSVCSERGVAQRRLWQLSQGGSGGSDKTYGDDGQRTVDKSGLVIADREIPTPAKTSLIPVPVTGIQPAQVLGLKSPLTRPTSDRWIPAQGRNEGVGMPLSSNSRICHRLTFPTPERFFWSTDRWGATLQSLTIVLRASSPCGAKRSTPMTSRMVKASR
jgi:hypothetical protein